MPSPSAATIESRTLAKTVAENVKETLESIVVAFILAFVFRAFIVEAFVIPTGSMAPTLYGNQLTKTCSTCGYEYAMGITENLPPQTLKAHCPNCDTTFDDFAPNEVARPDSGDRILVHKWPLNIGGDYLGPHRWDVTVFKDPRDGTTNFIKRLVGLPGEVIEIIDGDVYAVPLKDLKPELIQRMETLRLAVFDLRDKKRQGEIIYDHSRDDIKHEFLQRYADINAQLLPLLKIQRKITHKTVAQDSLWFNVYNNDFLPAYRSNAGTVEGTPVGWKPVDEAAKKTWECNNREMAFRPDGQDVHEIEFDGKEIDDLYAYNYMEGMAERGPRGRQRVGDVRLRFVWMPESGDGGLQLTMNRADDKFTATIALDGNIKIEGLQPELTEAPGHRQTIGEKKLAAFAPGHAVSIEFINLDYRVALIIDGQEVIASTDQQYAPQVANLKDLITKAQRQSDGYVDVTPTSVRIGAYGTTCHLRHVALDRDVYYRSQDHQESDVKDQSTGTSTGYNPYYLWPGWATAGLPMMLRKTHQANGQTFSAEYLMLGDNSPASKDSRLWWEIGPHLKRLQNDYQAGTVPEDQLIGKAFFVYWPAGYRPSWLSGVGLVPNFGRMRWIR